MNSYNAEQLEVLSGLEPVKKRPGMYTDTTDTNHLCQEVVDNCIDEALAGYAKFIKINISSEGYIEVTDDGRGIPADIHPIHKISGIEIIMTKLHSGAKFSNKSYKFSGGLHGVGISVVNALSKKLLVTVMRQGKEHSMKFADGHKVTDLETKDIAKYKHGTSIKFWPDPKYFDSPEVNISKLSQLLKAKAILCPGLRIEFSEPSGKEHIWHYENGIHAYLEGELDSSLPDPVFSHIEKTNDSEIEFAFAWTEDLGNIPNESYVNLIPTPLGGTHVNGLKQGIFDAVREFCELHEMMPKGLVLKTEDTAHELAYIISIKITDPQFAGQTKERLSNRQYVTIISQITKDRLSLFLNKNTEIGKQIAEKAIEKAESRYRKAKKVSRKKVTSGPALPGKLADCICPNREDTELFLVEGDSAGGSAKQARDKYNQAILPLRGKILNTWEIESDSVLESQTIADIATSIGLEPGSDDISNLRYGKICILADADSDGNHISTLLCALFHKHFNAVVKAGKLFIAMPPLYRIDMGKSVFYALDETEKNLIISKHKPINHTIQRFKGLGEMNPGQLRETTMHHASRRLVKLESSAENDTQAFNMLLAKKSAEQRRAWLENSRCLEENKDNT